MNANGEDKRKNEVSEQNLEQISGGGYVAHLKPVSTLFRCPVCNYERTIKNPNKNSAIYKCPCGAFLAPVER